MENVLIVKEPNLWNRAKAVSQFNGVMTELDTENTDLSCISVGEVGPWTEDLEFINNRLMKDPSDITKVDCSGFGTFVCSSLTFVDKGIIRHMKEGRVIIISHEVIEFINFFERRHGYLKDYQDIEVKLDKKEKELKDLKRSVKSLSKEEKEEFLISEGPKYTKKLEKLTSKIENLKRSKNLKRSDLGMAEFNAKYLVGTLFYLFKSCKPVYMNKVSGIVIFEIERKNSFVYKDFDLLSEVANDCRDEDLESGLFELKNAISPFRKFEFKLKVPVMVGNMISVLNEEIIEVDISGTISMAGSIPSAPVKASIAAAMLASGVGKLDKDILLDEEKCLIKTAITPVQRIETINVNGQDEVVKLFTWEPQLGLFNKLKKEFQILT